MRLYCRQRILVKLQSRVWRQLDCIRDTPMSVFKTIVRSLLLVIALPSLGAAQSLPECVGPPAETVDAGQGADRADRLAAAIDACRAAVKARPNDPQLKYQLGRALAAAGKHREAIQVLLDAAERGHSGSMIELGLLFELGLGVPKNQATALTWYEKAAESGDPQAAYQLGQWSESGAGGDVDLAAAKTWYEKAAALGSASAMNQLGVFYQEGRGVAKDVAAAHAWYGKAAALNFPAAMTHLGHLSETGRGAPLDLAAARQWYERAVALGHADAMARLGELYEQGRGVPANLATAKDWYDKGAARGSALAMADIARLLQEGRGVPRDLVQARFWYERAATQKLPSALNALGKLYLVGDGGPKHFGRARELFEEAVALGDANAMNSVGLLYLLGQAVERDEATAKEWFTKAAALGDKDGQANLSRIAEARRAGYASLGAQIGARRQVCAQSCRSLQRNYVTSVCTKYFPNAPVEQGGRRNCIDLSLQLSKQCNGSCQAWAQLSDKDNACETCLQTLTQCSANDTRPDPGQSQEARYTGVSQACLASVSQCSEACRAK
jgi:TPR repeat protein